MTSSDNTVRRIPPDDIPQSDVDGIQQETAAEIGLQGSAISDIVNYSQDQELAHRAPLTSPNINDVWAQSSDISEGSDMLLDDDADDQVLNTDEPRSVPVTNVIMDRSDVISRLSDDGVDNRRRCAAEGEKRHGEKFEDWFQRRVDGDRVQEQRMRDWMMHERMDEVSDEKWHHGRSDDRHTKDRIEDLRLREKVEEQRIRERIEEWRLRDGPDPDNAEFERLRTPPVPVIDGELAEVLHRRVVIVQGLTMDEMSHPQLLEVMSHCNEFRMSFVFKENSPREAGSTVWEGIMILFMSSINDADEAMKQIRDIRDTLVIRNMQNEENLGHLLDTWKDNLKPWMRRLSDDVMIVSQVTSTITKEDLRALFPDALDVIVPRERVVSVIAGDNQSQKGYAFLTFGNRGRMIDAFTRYSTRRLVINSQVLRVIKYEPPRDIPIGFLRLRRRFRIMCLIRDLKRAETCIRPSAKALLQKLRSHLQGWQPLIEQDDVIRKTLGVPAPTLDELHMLFSVPKPAESPMDGEHIDKILKASQSEQDQLSEMRMYRKERLKSKNILRKQIFQQQLGSHELGPSRTSPKKDVITAHQLESESSWVSERRSSSPHWELGRRAAPSDRDDRPDQKRAFRSRSGIRSKFIVRNRFGSSQPGWNRYSGTRTRRD